MPVDPKDALRVDEMMELFKKHKLSTEEGVYTMHLVRVLSGSRAGVLWFASELAARMAEIAEDEGVI